MATLKGTETEKNLLKAFAGESQARNRATATPILPVPPARKAMYRSPIFSQKPQTRNKYRQFKGGIGKKFTRAAPVFCLKMALNRH